jgi:hypothetical protein
LQVRRRVKGGVLVHDEGVVVAGGEEGLAAELEEERRWWKV